MSEWVIEMYWKSKVVADCTESWKIWFLLLVIFTAMFGRLEIKCQRNWGNISKRGKKKKYIRLRLFDMMNREERK